MPASGTDLVQTSSDSTVGRPSTRVRTRTLLVGSAPSYRRQSDIPALGGPRCSTAEWIHLVRNEYKLRVRTTLWLPPAFTIPVFVAVDKPHIHDAGIGSR